MKSQEVAENPTAEELYFKICVLYESGNCDQLMVLCRVLNEKYPESDEAQWASQMLVKCRIRNGMLLDYRWGYVTITGSFCLMLLMAENKNMAVRYISRMFERYTTIKMTGGRMDFGIVTALWGVAVVTFLISLRMLWMAPRGGAIRAARDPGQGGGGGGKCPACSEPTRREPDKCGDCGTLSAPGNKRADG